MDNNDFTQEGWAAEIATFFNNNFDLSEIYEEDKVT